MNLENKKKILRIILKIICLLIMAPICLWAIGAIYYSDIIPFYWLRFFLALLLPLAFITTLICFRRYFFIILGGGLLVCLLTACCFYSLTPSNNRDWQAPWSKMPEVEIQGNIATVKNVRDFQYETENLYKVNYRTMELNLDKVEDVSLVLSYWDNNKAIAHTMLLFGFSDGKNLVLSSETRLEKSDEQGALPGLYRKFELLYILGTSSDLLRLRTNFRHEQVYVYKTTSSPEDVRKLLEEVFRSVNDLRLHPEFYNTLCDNCTFALGPMLKKIRTPHFSPIRFIKNGFADNLAYQSGWIKNYGLEFNQLKKICGINQYVEDDNDPATYYKRFTEGIKKTILSQSVSDEETD
jgi:hypothetical protein